MVLASRAERAAQAADGTGPMAPPAPAGACVGSAPSPPATTVINEADARRRAPERVADATDCTIRENEGPEGRPPE